MPLDGGLAFLLEKEGDMGSYATHGLIITLVCICAACGGGGGGDEGNGVVDTNQPLALTSGNAVPVSGLVVNSAMGGITAGSLGTGVVASSDSPNEGGFDFNILPVVQTAADRIFSMQMQPEPTDLSIRATQVPVSLTCSGGGTAATTWNDADADGEFSERDGVTLTFNNCTEDDLVMNGQLLVGLLSLVGDPSIDPTWTVVFRLNFENLTASDGTNTLEVFGTLDATVETLPSGDVLTDVTTEVGTGPGNTASSVLHFEEGFEFVQLTLFSASFRENTDGTFVVSSQGTLESSYIGGTVTFVTTQDVTGSGFGVNNPDTGEIIISGAANSNVQFVIIDSVSVELDVDDEGDGLDAGDVTIPSSWDDLDAAVDAL